MGLWGDEDISQSQFVTEPPFQTPTSTRNASQEAPATSSSDQLPNSSGQVLLGLNETTYVGATHWAAILDDVGFPILLAAS